jgi:carboxymethylenebutenolidase
MTLETSAEPIIRNEAAVIATEGSRSFDGHFACPTTGSGPGLLIFSEMWGVAAKKREMADDYARCGWCAVAANMFWRSEFTGVVPFDQADKAWQRLQAFDFDQSAEDCRTAVTWLRRHPQCNGKVAAIGFCMGGRIAFLAASRAGVDAAIGLYALGIAKHLDEVRAMAVPLQLHYGLNDEHITKSEIDAVAAAAAGNSNIDIQLYPGAGHGFFNRTFSPDDIRAVEMATAHIDRFLAPFK